MSVVSRGGAGSVKALRGSVTGFAGQAPVVSFTGRAPLLFRILPSSDRITLRGRDCLPGLAVDAGYCWYCPVVHYIDRCYRITSHIALYPLSSVF